MNGDGAQVDLHPAGDRHLAFAGAQALACQVDGHVRGRAGGVDGDRRARQPQHLRHTRRHHIVEVTEHRVAGYRHGRAAQTLEILIRTSRREHADAPGLDDRPPAPPRHPRARPRNRRCCGSICWACCALSPKAPGSKRSMSSKRSRGCIRSGRGRARSPRTHPPTSDCPAPRETHRDPRASKPHSDSRSSAPGKRPAAPTIAIACPATPGDSRPGRSTSRFKPFPVGSSRKRASAPGVRHRINTSGAIARPSQSSMAAWASTACTESPPKAEKLSSAPT